MVVCRVRWGRDARAVVVMNLRHAADEGQMRRVMRIRRLPGAMDILAECCQQSGDRHEQQQQRDYASGIEFHTVR